MTKEKEIDLAYKIGQDAFKRHLKRVPAADPKYLQMLPNKKVGEGTHITSSWLKGWDSQNLKENSMKLLSIYKKIIQEQEHPEKWYITKNGKKLSSVYLNALPFGQKASRFPKPGYMPRDNGIYVIWNPYQIFAFRTNSWMTWYTEEKLKESMKHWLDSINQDKRFDANIKTKLKNFMDSWKIEKADD